jgi:ribosomal protein S25
MAKKQTQEENIHELTDRSKVSKAKKALLELKQRQQQPKKWVKVNSTTYIEVPKHFTKEQINERIEKLVNK